MSRKNGKKKSVSELIISYFKLHPKKSMQHGPVVDWVEKEYLKLYNKKPRDTWRSIRSLHERGFLVKVNKGIYCYDPAAVISRNLNEFTVAQKEQILGRDNYKCVMCGRGREDGVELHVDHIKPKYLGGEATIENGQTLCAQHNFLKKSLKQTETGKKMFIRLYELAKKEGNKELVQFCADVLKTYEKHNVNGHIPWRK